MISDNGPNTIIVNRMQIGVGRFYSDNFGFRNAPHSETYCVEISKLSLNLLMISVLFRWFSFYSRRVE